MKRIVDVIVASVLLMALAPLLALIAVAVRVTLGKPMLFAQMRPGLRGELFRMYKFRTMREAVDSNGRELPDSDRLTRFGRFLRSTSLDELPELVNVIRGDMSLVGPRPLLPEYLSLYTPRQAKRHEVRPGITGWAQVNGRNAISWEQRLEMDAWYVENRTLSLDLRILISTVGKVFLREGVNEPGAATTRKFEGKQSGDPA